MTGEMIIKLPRPHAGQIAARLGAKRFNHIRAGRRWRKTTLAMSIMVESAIGGGEYLWGAPVYEQARTGYEEMRRALHGVAKFNETRLEVALPTGGKIRCISLDNPDNARGKTADGVVIDEAQNVAAEAWHAVLRPMLMSTGGWAYFIYTPMGHNWLWHEWQAAIGGRADTALIHAPTLGVEITESGLVRKSHPMENPDIPFSELVDIYRSTPERIFRQEILAEFIEDGGGVFRAVRERATATPLQTPVPNHTYVAGLDWALSHDYTVLTVMDATDKREVWKERFTGIEYGMQRQRIAAVCERFGVSSVLAEQNAMGKPNNDELRRMGLPVRDFTTTVTTKADLIESLAAAFDHRSITILKDEVTIGELESYESKRTANGGVQYNAPSGMHDDTVMSMALAWAAIEIGNEGAFYGDSPLSGYRG